MLYPWSIWGLGNTMVEEQGQCGTSSKVWHANYAGASSWWTLVVAAIGLITSDCLAEGDLFKAQTRIAGV